MKRSIEPEGQIVNIKCIFKIKSPRNSERSRGHGDFLIID